MKDERPVVLIVDDEPINLKLLAETLQTHYRVKVATDGPDALRLARLEPVPELILLDAMMPEMDGYAVCAALKRSVDTAAIPAVFITAKIDPESETRALAAGAVDFIHKPINTDVVRARLRLHLELQRRTLDLQRANAELAEHRDHLEDLVRARTLALARARDAAEDANRAKSDFLANMSHELRNPLAPLRTGLDLLGLAGHEPATGARVVAMMKRQLDHLVRLVDDLLDVARVAHGKIELQREPCDLSEAIGAAIERVDPARARGGRRFRVSLPSAPLTVTGDPVRLAQAIGNLLGNAVKFTDHDGQIWLCVDTDSGQARISVRDDGEGIAPERLDTVFEMFSQAQPGRGGGLGIGLALVRSLVQLHGGRVEARSDGPGRGCEIVVYLPLAEPTPPAPSASAEAAPPDAGLAARRILVVDDQPDVADSFGILLETLGAQVQVAYDGPTALAAFAAQRPDAVFLDIGMPGMDGYEIARRLRAQCPEGDLLLVAVTGWGSGGDRQRALAAGFDRHLVKPASVASLIEVLAART